MTCLARGASGMAPEGATLIRADRRTADAYDAVKATSWDEIIELSYEVGLVTGALDALSSTARHWTLISSVSVYTSNGEPGADESAAVFEPEDLDNYAHAKVAAERASSAALGDRLLIARPGLIAGPGDTSDRFGYWVARFAFAQQEPVLVPRTEGRVVQMIDLRDLAEWVVAAGHEGTTGIYNVVGEQHELACWQRQRISRATPANACQPTTTGLRHMTSTTGPDRDPCHCGYRPATLPSPSEATNAIWLPAAENAACVALWGTCSPTSELAVSTESAGRD